MTRKQPSEILDRVPSPLSLLIAAHCSTIKRKGKRLEGTELSAIFDDIARELSTRNLRYTTYLYSLNEMVKILNSSRISISSSISSHYLFLLIRNTIRDLLNKFSQSKRLHGLEIYVLRNCVLLIHHLIKNLSDVSKVLHWITDVTFLDALADCLDRIDKLSKRDRNRHIIKQITRLLNMFCIIQERLPVDFHKTLFLPLLQPTIDCFTSSNYLQFFQNIQSNADSLTENQKLYLVKCPYFLTTYNGANIEKTMEQVPQIMLPRYVSILDKHIKTIKQWKRPIMRAIHNLIITIVYAEGYFSSYTNTPLFRSLINHLFTILNEPTLIKRIHPNSNNIETLLIDATLIVFNVLVYESNALDYIKQRKPSKIFRILTKTSYESIVLNAYMMLAYTIDDNDIKASPDDLPQLLSTTVNLLRKTIANPEQRDVDRSVLQLLETLKGLTQHEQIRNEIVKQDLVIFLIDYYKKLQGLSKQVLLECLWKLSFNEQIARQLREHPQFVLSLENLPKPNDDYVPPNLLRRSSSFGSRRNSISTTTVEATNYGIQKVADGILWKVVQEPQLREKMKNQIGTHDQQSYRYDAMISFSNNDKDIVQKIQQVLTSEGYNIWFERHHNHGHAMKIVAQAIENSEFVIICMSDSYKRDNHCQAQAEYASISKRTLLPLIVHNGYKPDGWLTPLIRNHTSIDFGASDFKVASQLLLKEIKQRQRKKDIPVAANIVPNLTVSNKPSKSRESSGLSDATSSLGSSTSSAVVDRQKSTSATSKSRSSTPGATISAMSTVIDKQQQDPTSSTARPSTPGTIHTVAPISIFKQRQHQPPIQPASTPSIPNSTPSDAASVRPISRATRSRVIPSNTSTSVIPQQQIPVRFAARSATPSSISSDPSVTTRIQEHQKTVPPVAKAAVSDSNATTTYTTIDKHQSQELVDSGAQSLSLASISPNSISDVDQRQQQPTTTNPNLKSSTSSTDLSDASVSVDRKQEEVKQTRRIVTRTLDTNAAPSMVQQQPTDLAERALTDDATSSVSSIAVDEKSQQQTWSVLNSLPPVAPLTDEKQRRPTSIYSTPKSSIVVPTDIEKQQSLPSRSNSRSSTPGSGVFLTPAYFEKQHQHQISSQLNSNSTTPAPPSNNSSTNLIYRVPSQTNVREQLRSLDAYINRKTHNSIYRTLPINAWRNNDVLDFLFDINLPLIMPLCESMSGKALIRLFRMCQKKPSRLYDQLNEELRVRFKGLTLPMGAYTQFLIEMDALVGFPPDAVPPIPDSGPKVVERVILMPRRVRQGLTNSTPSIPSSASSNHSSNVTLVNSPHNTRIVERTFYRTTSNIDVPYNFIIQSVEEPTILFNRVQRYGDQPLILDANAHQHRNISSYR